MKHKLQSVTSKAQYAPSPFYFYSLITSLPSATENSSNSSLSSQGLSPYMPNLPPIPELRPEHSLAQLVLSSSNATVSLSFLIQKMEIIALAFRHEDS